MWDIPIEFVSIVDLYHIASTKLSERKINIKSIFLFTRVIIPDVIKRAFHERFV